MFSIAINVFLWDYTGKGACIQKDGCSQKFQYKHYNGKNKQGEGGRVKDVEFSGV